MTNALVHNGIGQWHAPRADRSVAGSACRSVSGTLRVPIGQWHAPRADRLAEHFYDPVSWTDQVQNSMLLADVGSALALWESLEDVGKTGRRAEWMDEAAPEALWRRRTKPDNEVPASLAIDAVLASTEDVVAFVSGMSVYRNGVDFTVEVRARLGFIERVVADEEGAGLGEAMYGHDSDQGSLLLLGVEFEDGRSCSNVSVARPREGVTDAEQPRLWLGIGGADTRSRSASWFLSPLPPPGNLRFICAWTAGGVPETTTTLSADALLNAASRARELWPWEPQTPTRGMDTSPMPIPAGGWFAAHSSANPEAK